MSLVEQERSVCRCAAVWICAVGCLAAGAVRGEADAGRPLAGSPFEAVVEASGARRAPGSDPERGNRVALLNDGDEALLLRLHLIRAAARSINVQTFIWSNDECGQLLMQELVQAARRGVIVRIIADHFVSYKDPAVTASLAMEHPNLRIKHYRPAGRRIRPGVLDLALSFTFGFRNLNQRMHNKLMTFDDAVMITGGRNIENTYYNRSAGLNFKDRDILVLGPAVAPAAASFEEYWTGPLAVASGELADVAARIERGDFARFEVRSGLTRDEIFASVDRDANSPDRIRRWMADRLREATRVRFVADRPGKTRGLIGSDGGEVTRCLRELVQNAQDTVVIQTPYLVLSKNAARLFRRLKERALGVRVIVSSNSFASTDNVMAYSGNYRLRPTTIGELAFEVHEYRPLPEDLLRVFPAYPAFRRKAEEARAATLPFLCIHAKSLVVDARVAFVGSFNLDPRSERLNTEVGVLVEDEFVAAQLREEILRDTRPGNSWTVARTARPLRLDALNALLEGLSGLSPVDVWPIRNTSSFELIPGKAPVPPDHPDFYGNYRNAGSFPGAAAALSVKEIVARLYKAVAGAATPLL